MRGSPEQAIIQHWQAWNKLVKVKGVEGSSSPDARSFEFAIDRRTSEQSVFTADNVEILRLNIPLEDWTTIESKSLKSNKGEIWIVIEVWPKNPYSPKLGILSFRDTEFYYTEQVGIYLSNLGRAFEETTWNEVLKPVDYETQLHHFSYLKRYPKPEEIQVKFTEDPDPWMDFTEHIQPLKGYTLERLDFLLMKVKRGEIIEA